VDRDYNHLQNMVEASGQSSTPTFEFEDFIVADFSIEEFLDELRERPDMQARLGIADDSHVA